MKIIDFRLRPPCKPFWGTKMFHESEVRDKNLRLLSRPLAGPPSALAGSMDMLFAEMDEAGIGLGVAHGRYAPGTEISNDELARLVRQYPDKFVAFGCVDATRPPHEVKDEIKRAVTQLGLKGIHIDPGLLKLTPDHPLFFPIYEACIDLKVPVVMTMGALAGSLLSDSSPVLVDRVAAYLPELTIVLAHGCYPYVIEAISMAFRRRNVYLSPDIMLTNMPGSMPYVEAANTILPDRILFGSSYPYGVLKDVVDRFMRLPFTPKAKERVLWKNAARLLGLSTV